MSTLIDAIQADIVRSDDLGLAEQGPDWWTALRKSVGPKRHKRAMRHGTTNAYTNQRCRCQPCRDAWADYCHDLRERRQLRLADAEHGLASTYSNYRCRCAPCRAAAATRYQELREARA